MVFFGVDRAAEFAALFRGRVALLTGPSGRTTDNRSTVEVLQRCCDLRLLLAPEHGIRGDKAAGALFEDEIDGESGLPVRSLYTKASKRLSRETLDKFDTLVYDIADVGCRYYTFLSSLRYCIEDCAAAGKRLVVLDRPNPLGGLKVEGPLVRDGYHSFISQYKIPYIYGLTVGELALLLNSEGLNCGQKGNQPPAVCNLTVVPMEGWTRNMLYYDTGLPWVLPSPNIPFCDTPRYYAAAGIAGEISGLLQIGIGYTLPFQVFAAEWIDAEVLKAELESYDLPGVAFRCIYYKPFSGSQAGRLVQGVQYYFTDYEAASLTLVQFYVLQAIAGLYPDHLPFKEGRKTGAFDKVCGSSYVRETFAARHRVEDIREYWEADAASFQAMSSGYYLYQ